MPKYSSSTKYSFVEFYLEKDITFCTACPYHQQRSTSVVNMGNLLVANLAWLHAESSHWRKALKVKGMFDFSHNNTKGDSLGPIYMNLTPFSWNIHSARFLIGDRYK